MQKAAGTLFTIGKVLMIIEIVFCVLAFLVSIYGVANSEQVYQELIKRRLFTSKTLKKKMKTSKLI